jgi:hypothetical protein
MTSYPPATPEPGHPVPGDQPPGNAVGWRRFSRAARWTRRWPTPSCTRSPAVTFTPEFPLEWALKDVDLALTAANSTRLPMLQAVSRQWRAAVDAGYGRDDISAVRLALGHPAQVPG